MAKITPRFYAALFSAVSKDYQYPAEWKWIICCWCTRIQNGVNEFTSHIKRQKYTVDVYDTELTKKVTMIKAVYMFDNGTRYVYIYIWSF